MIQQLDIDADTLLRQKIRTPILYRQLLAQTRLNRSNLCNNPGRRCPFVREEGLVLRSDFVSSTMAFFGLTALGTQSVFEASRPESYNVSLFEPHGA
jgi:hypothetical protein